MIWTFFLTIGSTVTEVFPLNFLESALIDELESNKLFYRRNFSGSLTFVNTNGDDDFDLLYFIEKNVPCTKIIFTVKKSGVEYWSGYFSTTDGKFDLDRCSFEVNPLSEDDYAAIYDKADVEYNILLASPEVTTRALFGLRDVTYTRNRWLIDVIEYISNEVLPGVTISSDFFTEAINPVTLSDNHLLYLTIAQKSDIIRPTSTEPAQSAMLSWNGLMDILWGMFQVTWDYDVATDTINVEHYSWWTDTDGLDLRTQLMAKASNKYSYIKEEMPKYEYFKFAEADNSPFVGLPIWYDSKCVNQDPESNTTETIIDVTTDIQYIISNPDAIDDEGFVILCNYEYSPGVYHVEISSGFVSSFIALNCHLSWENLHNCYFRHNRVTAEGYLNGLLTTFWSTQKNKLQPINAIVCPSDDYDPQERITTELGYEYLGDGTDPNNIFAKVRRSELKPSGEMKFSLIYGEVDVTPTAITDPKFIYVTEEKGANKTTYTAVASENTGADVTLSLYLVLQDVDGITCDTASYDIVILSGTNTASVEIPWCVPVATPATCIVTLIPDNTDPVAQGWQVYYDYDLTAHC